MNRKFFTITSLYSVRQIEKSFDGLNFFEDISIKLKKTELVEIS